MPVRPGSGLPVWPGGGTALAAPHRGWVPGWPRPAPRSFPAEPQALCAARPGAKSGGAGLRPLEGPRSPRPVLSGPGDQVGRSQTGPRLVVNPAAWVTCPQRPALAGVNYVLGRPAPLLGERGAPSSASPPQACCQLFQAAPLPPWWEASNATSCEGPAHRAPPTHCRGLPMETLRCARPAVSPPRRSDLPLALTGALALACSASPPLFSRPRPSPWRPEPSAASPFPGRRRRLLTVGDRGRGLQPLVPLPLMIDVRKCQLSARGAWRMRAAQALNSRGPEKRGGRGKVILRTKFKSSHFSPN